MPFDTDVVTTFSRLRFAGLAGRARGEAGDLGRPLVFLHGLTFDRHMWDPILDALPPGQRAIAFDLPGHGGSRALYEHSLERVADAIQRAVVDAGLERPVLVGHSMGAALASIYATRHPAAGVVNVDAPVNVEPFARFVRSLAPQLLGGGFDETWSTIFRSSMHIERVPAARRALLRAGDVVAAELVLGYWSELFAQEPDELAESVEQGLRQLRDEDLPYLALYGKPLEPADEAWLYERLPQAELCVWPIGHHFPQLENPAGFAALVSAFAAVCEPAEVRSMHP
jgi:pimeloyl-ACP methyl ester carboxylesterase